VALKVLPAETASNPERLERFQREAKALGLPTTFPIFRMDTQMDTCRASTTTTRRRDHPNSSRTLVPEA